jgi:hypothetical protein
MFEKIYAILVDVLGESKQGYYDKEKRQYQFNCPCCRDENGGVSDGKYNLEINFSKMVFKCWKCHDINRMSGKISKLIKRYGNSFLYNQYKAELDNLAKAKLYDINAYQEAAIDIQESFVKLPDSFTRITDITMVADWRVKKYLEKRKITQPIIDKFKIGYTTWDDSDYYCRNRIVVPSYDDFGDLNYWSARDFTGRAKAKYKNSDTEKLEIIFQESLIDWDSDIVLCEGTLDAIYMDNCIALLGKSLSRRFKLYQTLKDKAKGKVIICLDGDTDISETKKIYNLLNTGSLRGRVYYIRLDCFKDFGEVYENGGKLEMIKTLKKIRQFDEIDLVL